MKFTSIGGGRVTSRLCIRISYDVVCQIMPMRTVWCRRRVLWRKRKQNVANHAVSGRWPRWLCAKLSTDTTVSATRRQLFSVSTSGRLTDFAPAPNRLTSVTDDVIRSLPAVSVPLIHSVPSVFKQHLCYHHHHHRRHQHQHGKQLSV